MGNFFATRAFSYVAGALIDPDENNLNEGAIFSAHNASMHATTGHGHTGSAYDGTKIGDTGINWGTGAGQVSAVDVPIADAGAYYPTDNVEAALQALASGAVLPVHTHESAAQGGTLNAAAIASGVFGLAHIPNLPTSQITSGTFADARIAASNVTQHQAALTIQETQIPDGAILARNAGNETITGAWSFTQVVNGQTPTLAAHLVTKAYVDGEITAVALNSTNEFSGVPNGQVTGSCNQTDAWFGINLGAPELDLMWTCSQNCTAGGRIYFQEANSDWMYQHNNFTYTPIGADANLWLRRDDGGFVDTQVQITGQTAVGGGEYYFDTLGAPDLSAWTTAKNSRFFLANFNARVAQRGGTYLGAQANNSHRFRLFINRGDCYLAPGTDNYLSVTLVVPGVAADDIIIPTLVGMEGGAAAAWDNDNKYELRYLSWSGGASAHSFTARFRLGDEAWFFDIEFAVIPRITIT